MQEGGRAPNTMVSRLASQPPVSSSGGATTVLQCRVHLRSHHADDVSTLTLLPLPLGPL